MYQSTFSIVARDIKTGALGVGVATANPKVRDRVPHVRRGVGAIATQGQTNVSYGIAGIEALEKGLSSEDVLNQLLAGDPDYEHRQVSIIDFKGRVAVFTGKLTQDWKGHIVGKGFIVAGNLLTGENVLKGMAVAFEKESCSLACRLINALKAGKENGGDKRGEISGALLVDSFNEKEIIDLRVDQHPDPVCELERIYKNIQKY